MFWDIVSIIVMVLGIVDIGLIITLFLQGKLI